MDELTFNTDSAVFAHAMTVKQWQEEKLLKLVGSSKTIHWLLMMSASMVVESRAHELQMILDSVFELPLRFTNISDLVIGTEHVIDAICFQHWLQ